MSRRHGGCVIGQGEPGNSISRLEGAPVKMHRLDEHNTEIRWIARVYLYKAEYETEIM